MKILNQRKMFIKYLFLPKGVMSILFKSYVYIIPFVFVLNQGANNFKDFVLFFAIFFIFEFIIGPARYQINDCVDFDSDKKRGNRWERPLNKDNKNTVIITVALRFILGTVLVFLIKPILLIIALSLILLQLMYDFFGKKHSVLLAVFFISVAYPIRALSVLCAFNVNFSMSVYLILVSIFFYSVYSVIQWRRNESIFILENSLEKKPNTDFFAKKDLDYPLLVSLFIYLSALLLLLVDLSSISFEQSKIVSLFLLLSIVIFATFSKDLLTKIAQQGHNIIVLSIFATVLNNPIANVLIFGLSLILLSFWYHRVYIEKFAINYFQKNKS